MSTVDEIARLRAQVADLLAAVKAVRARHVLRNITGGHCAACHRPWPCPTLVDLDGLGLGDGGVVAGDQIDLFTEDGAA